MQVTINSNFEHLVHPSTQQAIENACANYDRHIDDVMLVWSNENTDHNPTYDVYETDSEQNYLFSIDTDGDVIYSR